jgi:hypothetical protein
MLSIVVMNVGHYLIIMYCLFYVTYPSLDVGVTPDVSHTTHDNMSNIFPDIGEQVSPCDIVPSWPTRFSEHPSFHPFCL